MKVVAALLAAAATTALAVRTPVFPQQWTSVVTQHVAINQGGSPGANGELCCDYTSPECKVQTIYMAARQYFDFPNNRSATFTSEGTGVVTLYNDGKEYSVDANGACQSYCPLDGPMEAFGFEASAVTESGPGTYNGQACDKYVVPTLLPIGNITMSVDTWYVTLNGASGPDTPLADITDLTPFGEQLGTESSFYTAWTPGAPDASKFTVTGKATCKQAKGCNGSSSSSGQKEVMARTLKSRGVKPAGYPHFSPLHAELFEMEA